MRNIRIFENEDDEREDEISISEFIGGGELVGSRSRATGVVRVRFDPTGSCLSPLAVSNWRL